MDIPKDKLQHFAAGAAAAALAGALWFLLARAGIVSLADAWLAPLIAAGVTGITKEACDYLTNRAHPGLHTVDPWDAAATALGGVPVALLLLAAR